MALFSQILPAVDRPPRGWLLGGLAALLAADLLLLVRLDAAPLLLLLVACAAAWFWMVLRLPWAVALLAAGFPLLHPISLELGGDRLVFYLLRSILFAALVVFLFVSARRPGSLVASVLTDPVVLAAILLGLVLALGALWTPSPIYARLKLIVYGSTNIPLLIGGVVIARVHDGEGRGSEEGRGSREGLGSADARFDRFLRAVAVFALLVALASLVNLRVQYYPVLNRLGVLGINPIWVARIMGLGLFAIVALQRFGRRLSFPLLCAAVPISVVLILAGSRGPLLGLVLVFAIWGSMQFGRSVSRKLGALVATLAAAGIALLVMPDVIRDRFVRPFGGDLSDFMRLGILRAIGHAFAQVPLLGIGTGGFSEIFRMGDIRAYPHNIFAEITVENGLPGIVTLVLFLGISLYRGIGMRSDPRCFFAFAAFLFALWNAQFSGDIIGNEWIWLFAGLVAGRYR